MSKKRKSYLRGERGQAFADLIRGIPSEQILCVSLDISKYFHVVMMHNGLGEIVKPAFEIDFYQSGFDQLCQAIDHAKAETQAQVVLLGMESTSHYFENLARHLLQGSQPVTLINSFAVKKNRDQQLMHTKKTGLGNHFSVFNDFTSSVFLFSAPPLSPPTAPTSFQRSLQQFQNPHSVVRPAL